MRTAKFLNKIKKIISKEFLIAIALLLIMPIISLTWHDGKLYGKENEAYYNSVWCKEQKGQAEVKVNSKDRGYVRIDCLTKLYAVETDYAKKWAEAIGQSLYYADITGKEPAVLIIIKNKQKDQKHINKIAKLDLVKIFTINY